MATEAASSDDLGQELDRPLSTGGYVVLGLLLDGPASGWDLARIVERSIAHFWPLTRAHIYAELPKIARRGWAVPTEVPQQGAPDKRVFAVTKSGREAFATWLATVDLTEERGRQPLQLRLFFAAHATPERLDQLFEAWRQQALDTEERCGDILSHKGVDVERLPQLTLDPTDDLQLPTPGALAALDLRGMTALFALRRAQADLATLVEVREALSAHPGRLSAEG